MLGGAEDDNNANGSLANFLYSIVGKFGNQTAESIQHININLD